MSYKPPKLGLLSKIVLSYLNTSLPYRFVAEYTSQERTIIYVLLQRTSHSSQKKLVVMSVKPDSCSQSWPQGGWVRQEESAIAADPGFFDKLINFTNRSIEYWESKGIICIKKR